MPQHVEDVCCLPHCVTKSKCCVSTIFLSQIIFFLASQRDEHGVYLQTVLVCYYVNV